MSFCLYLRKSRADIDAEVRGEGETLARHEKILLDLAKKMKITIGEIYREVVSGETIASRPVIQKLLSDIELDLWKGVLVMEVERLARGDTMDQGIVAQTFKYSDTKIITPVKTYDPNNEFDEEYFEFGLFMSRREYKTINRRLQQGRVQSVKEGKFVGNIAPYGYTRKKLEGQKGYMLEINPEQAKAIKLIYELFTLGERQLDGTYIRLGPHLIAKKLNSLKISPAKSNLWSPASIRDILRNPVYMGKIRWNGRPAKKKMLDGKITKERPRSDAEDVILVEGLHDAIIDEELWNTTQEYITSRRTSPVPAPKDLPIKNPLSGLLVCGMCGRNIIRRPQNNYQDVLLCPSATCKNVGSNLASVESSVLLLLESWLVNYKLRIETERLNNPSNNLLEESVIKIDTEINKLQTQMNSLHDLLEQGVYTTDKFLERSKILSDKINLLESDKKVLAAEINRTNNTLKISESIIPKLEHVIELYSIVDDPAIKNELLKDVIDKIVYVKETGGRWSGKQDDFELHLHPRIPQI